MREEIFNIVKSLTLEEKAALCSGRDLWHTEAIEKAGLPSMLVTDGPHGLRKQKSNSDLSGGSYEATCFPTASCLASSWDRELIRKVGEALGEECLQEDVGVLLGPGANIKRSPLCGRNFEYFSEDPFLTGELASALIEGVQSKGVGTSLKHFAVNNQEYNRLTINAFVDERALREVYLAGFEKAVKKARPWTLMCAYNQVNGCYASENRKLLTDILRDEWKFEGIVMSDWGAVNDRVEGLKAGLDLEMPGASPDNDRLIVEAVRNGTLDESVLDNTAAGMIELIMKYKSSHKNDYNFNQEAHHELAVKAATEGAVLLKNEGDILPLKKGAKIALIGEFARIPRYQGAGSSQVNPLKLENAFERGIEISPESTITYSRGYDIKTDQPDQALISEACRVASSADVAVIMAGLTDSYESEGFDRDHIRMPPSHDALIREVAKSNPNTVVVLCNGSPVEMPWISDVKSVLDLYLAGEGSGSALWRLLYGDVNPSGKLAESFPVKLEDCPAASYFPMGPTGVEYRESIYVGYRFYDKADAKVLFPFGHGLSYTRFEYGDLKLGSDKIADTGNLSLTFKIRNTGDIAGSEIAQVYVRDLESTVFRPLKELKEFVKVRLDPGEEKEIMVTLDKRAFAYYDVNLKGWQVESGEFEILVGASSRDIRLTARLKASASVPDEMNEGKERFAAYYSPVPGWTIAKEEFEILYGKPIIHRPVCTKGNYNPNSTISELRKCFAGRVFYRMMKMMMGGAMKDVDEKMRLMVLKSLDGMPLRQLTSLSGGKFSKRIIDGLLLIFDGRFLKGMGMVLFKGKSKE